MTMYPADPSAAALLCAAGFLILAGGFLLAYLGARPRGRGKR